MLPAATEELSRVPGQRRPIKRDEDELVLRACAQERGIVQSEPRTDARGVSPEFEPVRAPGRTGFRQSRSCRMQVSAKR